MKMGSGAPGSVRVSTRNRSEFHQTQDLEISQFWSISGKRKKVWVLENTSGQKGNVFCVRQSRECSVRAWPRDL